MNFSPSDHLIVRLKNVVVETRCGIHPWEQHPERPNKLSIDISLFAKLEHPRLATFGYIDYDHIRDFLKAFPDRPHTPLLETLLPCALKPPHNPLRPPVTFGQQRHCQKGRAQTPSEKAASAGIFGGLFFEP